MDASFITTSAKARRAGLHSDVVLVDGWGFISGQQPIDLQDDKVPLPEMVEDQTRKIFANLETLLRTAGLSKENVVSVRVYLSDFKRFFERMNTVYAEFFPKEKLPARTCVGVSGLTRGALIEMDFVLRA